jgi:hypothetical protein
MSFQPIAGRAAEQQDQRNSTSARGAAGEAEITDLDWARPRFSAAAEDRQRWRELLAETAGRRQRYQQTRTGELEAAGLERPRPQPSCYSDVRCQLVLELDRIGSEFESWEEFSAALSEALLAFRSYRAAVDFAEERAAATYDPAMPMEAMMERRLSAAVLADQVYRNAAPPPTGRALGLSGKAALVFTMLAQAQSLVSDSRNARLLGWYLEQNGWPAPERRELRSNLWLLAQHAPDPLVQLRVLRYLQQDGLTSASDAESYRYLADRLEMHVFGTQTYGTQLQCSDGTLRLAPVGNALDILGVSRPDPQSPPTNSMVGRPC